MTLCLCDLSPTPTPQYHPHHRAKIPQTKDEIDQQRGQATTDGLHSRAAAKTKIGVSDKSVPDRAEATEPGAGAGPERVPDQDLVSEQEGQNQEGQRLEKLSGLAPDGAGTVQSQHRHVERRKIRQRLIYTGSTPPDEKEPIVILC